ncbi:MAG: signal peptide peptidase SppA [Planctomycetota bacterium]|nr:signal peptide peptidase SppA [Planctomycetota bacterium]
MASVRYAAGIEDGLLVLLAGSFGELSMFMRRYVSCFFVTVLCVTVFSSQSMALWNMGEEETATEENPPLKVVELTLSSSAWEDPPQPNPLGPTQRNFRRKLGLLQQLAADPEIAGVTLEVKGTPSFAHCLDLLDELKSVKNAGKKIVCYAESLDQRQMMFASLADHLVMPPGGAVGFSGLTVEAMYLKDMLETMDLRFEVLHVGDFKTAGEDFALSSMSESQRTMLEEILNEYSKQMMETIAGNRGLTLDALGALFEKVYVTAEDARQSGLIDAVAYRDDFDHQVEGLFGGSVGMVEDYGDEEWADLEKQLESPFAAFALLGKLLNPPKLEAPDEPHVAIIYCTGPIMSGDSTVGWDGRVASMGSDTIVEALDQVYRDDDVKAVVLRVNSPGGSALASDMIWGAIERVQTKKPVIASMGSVAASGGYWISMGCDAIVAQPSTITGSIGVVSMILDPSHLLSNIGVNVEVVSRSPHGDRLSVLKHGVTPEVADLVRSMMDPVYAEFVQKVSEGRRMQIPVVESLAGGRVWTGRQAEQNGLVDELGGLEDAVALACVMGGGLSPLATPIMEYPVPPNFMDQMEEQLGEMASAKMLFELASSAVDLGHLRVLFEQAVSHDDLFSPGRVQAIMPMTLKVR